MSFPENYVFKTVPLRYDGVELSLKVSHALFSSNRVDDGTMLLLKTLAQRRVVPERGRVLDLGCGVGPLALALAKRHPALNVHARDRSVLACAFTAENARLNRVDVEVRPALIGDPEELKYDLVVSNLPAKAGPAVLGFFLKDLVRLLNAGGLAVVVVVDTLAGLDDQANALGWETVFSEKGPKHAVYHWRVGPEMNSGSETTFPGSYLRLSRLWRTKNFENELSVVWGLPNFDADDYRLQTQAAVLEKEKISGRVLVWEPGQGQSALLAVRGDRSGVSLVLAGTDLLALRIARYNAGAESVFPVSSLGELNSLEEGSFSIAVVNLRTEPHVSWVEETRETLGRLLQTKGKVVLSGTSTDLARFLERHRGFRVVSDVRYRGWRSVLFAKVD